MAVIRKKGNKGVPPISTASLPDVIFMILFFFMTTTSMKETELRVAFTLPEATEIQKLEKKSLVSYIYVGQPTKQLQAQFGTAPRIQLNDTYRTPQDTSLLPSATSSTKATAMPCRFVSRPTVIREWVSLPT